MAPKRKRAGTVGKDGATAAKAESEQVGNDSGDKATEPLVKQDEHGGNSMDPPSKRTRAGSTRTSSKSIAAESNGEFGAGENGEAATMKMDAPPKAGAVDPVGYKTNAPPKDRSVRIYADGVFDLFHLGHMRQLQQAKTAFPDVHLIVGVTGDKETHKRKGLTVLSAKERAESIRHCRWVDEVIEDCPWVIDVAFLEKHKIDYVAHDDIPYGASEGDDIYAAIKKQGKFLVTQRTEGVSTTGIITKIVRDYEQYIERQLKRGTSRQELNVSWFKKNEMDIKRHVGELRDNIRNNWTTTGQELSKEIRQFWAPSRPGSPGASLRNGSTPGRAGARSPNSTMDRLQSGSINTPGRERGGRNTDFEAGYAMGLIGGVKGWMQGSHRRNLSDSRGESPTDESSAIDALSPPSTQKRKKKAGASREL